MAEVAAVGGAALAVEEVLSTAVQVGVAGYFLTTPTQPLKATFTRIATADDDDMKRLSLTRSKHTVTVVNDKAYIFGGETAAGKLASNDLHVVNLAPEKNHEPEYQVIPAIAKDGSRVPAAREGHAACAYQGSVAIFGGRDESGNAVEETSSIWFFDPGSKTWRVFEDAGPGTRSAAKLFAHEDSLVMYGGLTADGSPTSDIWIYDGHRMHLRDAEAEQRRWSQLPNPPALAQASNAAVANGHLYLVSCEDPMSSKLHMLRLPTPVNSEEVRKQELKWTSVTFPTNPLAPGPRARHGGALLPVTTGYGRNYLVYLLGARDSNHEPQEGEATQWSDTWTLQLPSSNLDPKPKFNISEAIKPAKIKDAIRSSVGADSGTWTWGEVQVQVPAELGAEEGKLHPGPRALFGADVARDGRSVVFWGGEDPDGGKVGDGWMLRLE